MAIDFKFVITKVDQPAINVEMKFITFPCCSEEKSEQIMKDDAEQLGRFLRNILPCGTHDYLMDNLIKYYYVNKDGEIKRKI